MKRSILPFLFFCVFLLSAGCGSQPENAATASEYSVKSQAEISVSNDGFPISISNLLDRFKTYDFYETLKCLHAEVLRAHSTLHCDLPPDNQPIPAG